MLNVESNPPGEKLNTISTSVPPNAEVSVIIKRYKETPPKIIICWGVK